MNRFSRILLLSTLLALSACGPHEASRAPAGQASERPELEAEFLRRIRAINEETRARRISVAELRGLLDRQAPVVLIDTREPEEHRVSSLPGARNVPPREIPHLELDPPAGATVVTYCTVGYRSGLAAVALEKKLARPVYNLDGGIIAWFNEGGEVWDLAGRKVETIHPYDADWARYVTRGSAHDGAQGKGGTP